MRAIVIAVGMMLASAAMSPALAQQLPRDDDPWTSFYVGFGIGGGELSTDQYSPPQQTYPGYAAASYGGGHPYALLQAGGDIRFDRTVLGLRIEQAATWSDADFVMKVDELVSANAKFLTTLSARAGYLLTPTLLGYASASFVAGQFSYGSVDERWDLVADDITATRFGWGVGVGLEYLLGDQISVFAEYDYLGFASGSSTFDYGSSAFPPEWTYEYTHDLGIVKTGLNFRF